MFLGAKQKSSWAVFLKAETQVRHSKNFLKENSWFSFLTTAF